MESFRNYMYDLLLFLLQTYHSFLAVYTSVLYLRDLHSVWYGNTDNKVSGFVFDTFPCKILSPSTWGDILFQAIQANVRAMVLCSFIKRLAKKNSGIV